MGTQRMTLVEYCEQHPENKYLLNEWDYDKNKGLDPSTIGFRANKRVYWKMPYDDPNTGKHFELTWDTRLADRVGGSGCPYLKGRLWPGLNDLATKNPELASQWHPVKNGNLKPTDVVSSQNIKVWWQYKIWDNKNKTEHILEWQSSVKERAKRWPKKCKIVRDFEKKYGIQDDNLKSGDKNQKIPLSCSESEIFKQLHPVKNDKLVLDKTYTNLKSNVWWMLPYNVPMDYPVEHLRGKHFDFEWLDSPYNRYFKKYGCPFLEGRAIWVGFNDLATTHPELAKQWHPSKNIGLKTKRKKDISSPDKIIASSGQKVWWLLPYDVPMDYPIEHLRGRHFDFEWEAKIQNRAILKHECPFLSKSNPAVWKGFNDFTTTHPELAKEFHPTKNGNITPQTISHGYRYNVWWLLPYTDPKTGKHYDYEWEARIADRINKNRGCPFLHNSFGEQQVTEVLDKYKIHYKPQYKFSDRRRNIKHSQPLKDDFAILDDNDNPIATIEYHGQQHYYPLAFHGEDPDEAFKLNQERDTIKTQYLKEHNIPQLIIPYWDYDNIESIVINFLHSLNIL